MNGFESIIAGIGLFALIMLIILAVRNTSSGDTPIDVDAPASKDWAEECAEELRALEVAEVSGSGGSSGLNGGAGNGGVDVFTVSRTAPFLSDKHFEVLAVIKIKVSSPMREAWDRSIVEDLLRLELIASASGKKETVFYFMTSRGLSVLAEQQSSVATASIPRRGVR